MTSVSLQKDISTIYGHNRISQAAASGLPEKQPLKTTSVSQRAASAHLPIEARITDT